MGFSASATVHFFAEFNAPELLEVLANAGWSPDLGQGMFNYCFEDDAGDLCDWQIRPIAELPLIEDILRGKQNGRPVGFGLYRRDDDFVCDFLFYPERKVMIVSIGVGRRTLPDALPKFPRTDFSWYSERILAPLVKADCGIEYVTWSEGW